MGGLLGPAEGHVLMGKKRSVTQILAVRGDDAHRSAAARVVNLPADKIKIDRGERNRARDLLRQLGCLDIDKGLREAVLAAEWARLAISTQRLNRSESVDFAETMQSSIVETTRLLESELQNEWLFLAEHLAIETGVWFEGASESPIDDEEYWRNFARIQRCMDELREIGRAASRAAAHRSRAGDGPRLSKRPELKHLAAALLRWRTSGLISHDAALSNDSPTAELFRCTCRIAGFDPPDNVAYYLRDAKSNQGD